VGDNIEYVSQKGNDHFCYKRPYGELGVGGLDVNAGGMEYYLEVQRNYSSKNAISFEYLGGNVKGFLAKMKILF